MRKVIHTCERCNREFPETVAQSLDTIVIMINPNHDEPKKTEFNDICAGCSSALRRAIESWAQNKDPLENLAIARSMANHLLYPNTVETGIQGLTDLFQLKKREG